MFTINNAMKDKKEYYCRKCMIGIHKKGYAKSVGKSIDDIVKRVEIINGKKQCCRCKEWKTVNNYSKVSTDNFKCGLYSLCKECDSLTHAIKSRIHKMEFMLGYNITGCVCCGETEFDLLTIEHIRGKGHKLIYDDTRVLFYKLKGLGYPDGYTLLCYNCNMSTKHGKPCVHTKEYRVYEGKLETRLLNDKRLNKYNSLMNTLNERRIHGRSY
jgi:hypothetical protein